MGAGREAGENLQRPAGRIFRGLEQVEHARFREGLLVAVEEQEDPGAQAARAVFRHHDGDFTGGQLDERVPRLRAGRGLAIIELNGVTSETINIYDPNLSVWFAWAILRKQWKIACDLGGWRKAQGVKPMGVFALLFGTRDHLKNRRSYASAS